MISAYSTVEEWTVFIERRIEKHSSETRAFYLSSIDFTNQNMSHIVEKINANPTIKIVSLSSCGINSDGANALALLQHVTALTLSGNGIDDDGVEALAKNKNIEYLDLIDNNLLTKEAVKILLKFTRQTTLRVASNHIDYADEIRLREKAEKNRTVPVQRKSFDPHKQKKNERETPGTGTVLYRPITLQNPSPQVAAPSTNTLKVTP
jgi:hypothetical protein